MKKTLLITTGIVIGGLLVSSLSSSFASGGFGFGQGYSKSNSGTLNSNYSTYGVNMTRTVKNISNGVEITMTTKDSATLEHMKTMFTQNSSKTPNNSLIKIERTQLTDGMKMTVTSTDANTIKSIQDRANSAKSGVFGKGGQGGGGMMRGGFGGGQEKGNGTGNGGCQMFR